MSLTTILLIGAILSVAFHFLGVYTGDKKDGLGHARYRLGGEFRFGYE